MKVLSSLFKLVVVALVLVGIGKALGLIAMPFILAAAVSTLVVTVIVGITAIGVMLSSKS